MLQNKNYYYIIKLYDIIYNIDGGIDMKEKYLPVGTVLEEQEKVSILNRD